MCHLDFVCIALLNFMKPCLFARAAECPRHYFWCHPGCCWPSWPPGHTADIPMPSFPMQLSSPSSPVLYYCLGVIAFQLWDLGLRCCCSLFPSSSQERFPETFFLITISALCSNIHLFITPLSSDLCKCCRAGPLALKEVSIICYLLYFCYSDITFIPESG